MSTTEEIPADWQVEDNMVPPKDGLVADAMFDDETSQGRDGDGDPLDQNAEEESRPTRTTRMTAKSIEYQRSLLLKDRNRMVNRLERKGTAINKLLSLGSITAIEEALSQYDDTARLFQEAHRKYTKFVPIEEKANDDGWYDTIDDEIFNIKHQAISVLRELKQKEDVGSRCSRTSRKSKSIRSGAGKGSSKSSSCSRSRRSSNSSNGSVKEQMLEENLRIAELQTEADFLEEQYKTSFLAASLKHRQEMAKASARMKVLQQQEDQIRIKDEHLSMLNEQKVNDIKEDLETSVDEKYPDTANDLKGDDVDDNFNSHYNSSCQRQWIKDSAMKKEAISSTSSSTRVNEMLCQLLKVQSAPEVDVEAFNGDPLDFNFFMMMFKEVVETKIEDQKGRLTRLMKYTTGEARETIKHCIQFKKNGYDEAVRLLYKRYGDPHLILATYRKQIRNWPAIKFSDGKGFREFLNFIVKCESFICDDWNILDSPETICMLISKLPVPLVDRWNRKVMMFRRSQKTEPRLAELVRFVEQETLLVNDPLYSRDAIKQNMYKDKPPDKKQRNYKTLAIKTDKDESQQLGSKLQYCQYCDKGSHDFDDCAEFMKIPVDERSKFLGERKLCYGCYLPISSTHNARTCTRRRTCKVCARKHPTSLHGFQLKVKKKESLLTEAPCSEDTTSTTTSTVKKSFYTSYGHVLSMCIVPVKVFHPTTSRYVTTMAMLDSCSQATFVADSLVANLGLSGRKTSLSVKTINGTERIESSVVEGLSVSSLNNDAAPMKLKLPNSYTRDELPVDPEEVATKQKLKKWKHLQSILHYFPDKDKVKVELLIGANCLKALEPIEVISSQDEGPYAYKTILGWCVVGPISGQNKKNVKCSRIAVRDGCDQRIAKHHFEVTTTVKEEEIKGMLEKLYTNDFIENKVTGSKMLKDDEALSEDEKEFMRIMEEGVTKKDGHYVLPLPFKREPVFPDNRFVAERRLAYLKKKLMKDHKFFNDYKGFMDKVISEGYAVKCSSPAPIGKTWYLPHHGVYHPKKPGKIRVVLDCGAECDGKSLNSELLSGPDLTNQLVGILTRFREERIGIMADIQAMYYQVFVPENQRSFLRFLWWEDHDITRPPVDYEMRVHVFGATSSASCANYALRRTASDNMKGFSEDITETPAQNFYVDDMLKSKKEVQESIVFIKGIKKLCQLGGFNLTKFVVNSYEVLKTIPVDDRGPIVKEVSICDDIICATERALGVLWKLKEDAFIFDLKLRDKPLTRRGLLSAVSSIYDPLGFISPLMLKARIILRDLCQKQVGWDDNLPDEAIRDWLNWKRKLNLLDDISIPRCYKPSDFGEVSSCTIHHFSDASEKGYGQVSYLRLINKDGKVHVSFLMGKSRVTPIKFVSIPRLELCAAVLSSKMSRLLMQELQVDISKQVFWTDSQVVLSYLQARNRRFKTFVANRIQMIKSLTDISDWKYVKSSSNPADISSRGINPDEKKKIEFWFNGPEFLWTRQEPWKDNYVSNSVLDDDPEVKTTTTVNVVLDKHSVILEIIERVSSWNKIKRIMAWIMRFRHWKSKSSDHLSVEEIENGGKILIKLVQADIFKTEMKMINAKKDVSGSNIASLDPFITDDGILRVGGRLKRSNLDFELKHPILLPYNHRLSDLIVRWAHENIGHGGRGFTLNELRRCGFWIVKGNTLVRKMIFNCVICKHLRGRAGEQKMADLPVERTTEAAPFTYCGVDLFGPFKIKVKRTELKRYGVLFTCFTSRAVHIEVASSLSTDAFILALRRFIGRRGMVRQIFSDNGTNFVGADSELRNAVNEMDHEKINDFLNKFGGDWKWNFNPPASSHMGGVWERQILSARNILKALLKTHGCSLDEESLSTLIIETEAIINSRPITVDTINDVNSPMPLSPINVLTMKSNVILPPPGEFPSQDLYLKKRWRRVQHIANEFWSRWRKEYLQDLQRRKKWFTVQRNFGVGDIVILKDHTLMDIRNKFPMGKIVKVFNDENGSVRSVDVMVSCSKTILRRPITKLVLLVQHS